jgi:hypothetical protein
MAEHRDLPERPRAEPEIIPPDRARNRWTSRGNEFPYSGGTRRIYITSLGPFGGILLVLAIAILAAVILLAFLGALLIWIPVVALIVIVGALSGLLRLRRW